ncbi:MAG: aldehyde dehydrogenase family protein [Actinobacteria bacterium]|nr:aldehyde dehydrogenase family protein [Actinomycetota bacterium]
MAQLIIDGKRVDGAEGTYPIHNPARPDEAVHEAPAASIAQLDEAVAAARRAAREWGATPVEDRAAQVSALSEPLMALGTDADFVALLVREHGKPLAEASFEAFAPGGMAGIMAPMAVEHLQPEQDAGDPNAPTVTREPFGVVGVILPFNWPLGVMALKVIPSLLAGNALVVKTPPTCPGAVLDMLAAIADGLPAGVLNTVNSPGIEVGEALVVHDGIDMVSFTGGGSTGAKVMAAAAGKLRPVLLELGGNDPAIIGADVEITDALIDRLWDSSMTTSGQVCMAVKRLYVPADKERDFVDALVERAAKVTVGDGLADGVTMGPVHTARARDFAEGLLADAEQAGAKVHRPATLRAEDAEAGGHFVSPAIVEGAARDTRVVREEQFTPLLPVLPYADLDDAVAQANDTEYGLCASIWSADAEVADSIAHRLEAGTVWVNHHSIYASDPRAPFGGWKESGIGRELGADGILSYTHPRSIVRHPLP